MIYAKSKQPPKSIFNRGNRREDLQGNPDSLQASLNGGQPAPAQSTAINPTQAPAPTTPAPTKKTGLSGLKRKIPANASQFRTPPTGSQPMSEQNYNSANKQFIDTITQPYKVDPNQYGGALKTQQGKAGAYNQSQQYNAELDSITNQYNNEISDIDLANDQFRTNFKNAEYVDKLTTGVQDQYRAGVRDPSQIAKTLGMSLDDVNLVVQGRGHEILQFSDKKMDELSKGYQWNKEDLDIQKNRALQDYEVTKTRADQNYKWNMDDLEKDFGLANQLARKVGVGSGAILSSGYQEGLSVMRQAFDTTMSRLAVNHENDTYDLIKNKDRLLQDIDTNISRLKYTHDKNIKANKDEALGIITQLRSKYDLSNSNFQKYLYEAKTNYLANINKVFEYDMSYMKEMMSMYNNEINNLNTQKQRYMDVYASNPALANAMYPGLGSQVTEQQAIQQSISEYGSSIAQVQGIEKGVKFLSKVLGTGTNGNRNSCGMVTNDYLASIGATDGKVFDDLASKTKTINSKTPVVGSVLIMESKTSPTNGHTAIVLGMNNDGSIILADGNGFGAGKNKVGQFTAEIQDGQLIVNGRPQGQVYGFHIPSTMQQQQQGGQQASFSNAQIQQFKSYNGNSIPEEYKTSAQKQQFLDGYSMWRDQNPQFLSKEDKTAIKDVRTNMETDPAYKAYRTISSKITAFNGIVSRLRNNTATAQDKQALISDFAKVLDPTSVVREGEYALAGKYSQSKIDQYKQEAYNFFTTGGPLSKEGALLLSTGLEQQYRAIANEHDNVVNKALGTAKYFLERDITPEALQAEYSPYYNQKPVPNVNDMIGTLNNLSIKPVPNVNDMIGTLNNLSIKPVTEKGNKKIKPKPGGKAR